MDILERIDANTCGECEPECITECSLLRDCAAELTRLRAELAEAKDKALRFDLDELGILSREREAVELVELRADLAEARALVEKLLDFVPTYATGGGFMGKPTQWWFRSRPDGEIVEYDGTRAGLLAAVDEACP